MLGVALEPVFEVLVVFFSIPKALNHHVSNLEQIAEAVSILVTNLTYGSPA